MKNIPLLCVTNRSLCPSEESFLIRLDRIASALKGDGAILLREKNLPEMEYDKLAQSCQGIVRSYQIPLILHSYPSAAEKLATPLHLPLALLRKFAENRTLPTMFGSSIHRVEEAKEAEQLGASYLIAGHIFSTDCKKGLPARGLNFLHQMVQSTKLSGLRNWRNHGGKRQERPGNGRRRIVRHVPLDDLSQCGGVNRPISESVPC